MGFALIILGVIIGLAGSFSSALGYFTIKKLHNRILTDLMRTGEFKSGTSRFYTRATIRVSFFFFLGGGRGSSFSYETKVSLENILQFRQFFFFFSKINVWCMCRYLNFDFRRFRDVLTYEESVRVFF
jgi:hypothetical protein